MFSTDFLLKLLNKDKVSKYIYLILFISITTVFDFFTLFIFGHLIGVYLYLAIITTISLLGVSMTIKLIKTAIDKINKKHNLGIFPEIEFYEITALFIASLFIIFPGIISSICGFIIILPYFRQLIGRKLSCKLKLDWYAVYEYKEIYNN